jgi:hypothetical protein
VALSHERCTTARKPVATAFRFSESTQHSFAATAQPKTAPLIDDANEQLTDITGVDSRFRRRPAAPCFALKTADAQSFLLFGLLLTRRLTAPVVGDR